MTQQKQKEDRKTNITEQQKGEIKEYLQEEYGIKKENIIF